MTANFNHKVYCRQALVGGNYGLLDIASFVPNPDYYGYVALLFSFDKNRFKKLIINDSNSLFINVFSIYMLINCLVIVLFYGTA